MSEEKQYNNIIVVDENNENPRAVTYPEAKANNWIRRASRVFVLNEDGKMLIQKRSQHISKPFLLDNSAAGHVDEGEEYIDAALRELEEEIGISAVEADLIELPLIRETGFFSKNYKLLVSNNQSIVIDPHEVETYYWMSPGEIDELAATAPEKCTDSLLAVWSELRDDIINT